MILFFLLIHFYELKCMQAMKAIKVSFSIHEYLMCASTAVKYDDSCNRLLTFASFFSSFASVCKKKICLVAISKSHWVFYFHATTKDLFIGFWISFCTFFCISFSILLKYTYIHFMDGSIFHNRLIILQRCTKKWLILLRSCSCSYTQAIWGKKWNTWNEAAEFSSTILHVQIY